MPELGCSATTKETVIQCVQIKYWPDLQQEIPSCNKNHNIDQGVISIVFIPSTHPVAGTLYSRPCNSGAYDLTLRYFSHPLIRLRE
jgi:hypothetical protein